jgi:hypothetical protein
MQALATPLGAACAGAAATREICGRCYTWQGSGGTLYSFVSAGAAADLATPAAEEDLQRSRLSVRRGGGGGGSGGGRLSAEDLQRLREQQALADQVGVWWGAPQQMHN